MAIISQCKVGQRVRVTARHGGLFYSHNEGKEGAVVKVEGTAVYVKFDGNSSIDYGHARDLQILEVPVADPVKDAQGFIRNTTLKMPVPRGTKLDILYKDGTLILDLPVGDGTSKRASNNDNEYSATSWTGTGSAGIKAYRFPADRPALAGTRIKIEDMQVGMRVKCVGEGNDRHRHWGFVIGKVYTVKKEYSKCGPESEAAICTTNWGEWTWEVVEEGTLDDQLAALRAQLDAIKEEKARAEREVTEAQQRVASKQAVVAGIEARRVELLNRLTKHGIQFINEAPVAARSAKAAHEAGDIVKGTVLLCNIPHRRAEHTAGKTYAVRRVDDRDSTLTYFVESDDGIGYWMATSALHGYTIVG